MWQHTRLTFVAIVIYLTFDNKRHKFMRENVFVIGVQAIL